jgi:CRP/FNR family transcriptional regulator
VRCCGGSAVIWNSRADAESRYTAQQIQTQGFLVGVQNSLDRFEPFNRLSSAGKKILSQGLILTNSSKAEAVLHKGQPVSGAYLVVDGRLRVFTITPHGKEATLYFVDPGEASVLALNCLFNDLLYPAWVQAETRTTIAVIPGAVYRRLFETESVIQNLTIQALSTLVFRLMAELEQVHSSNHKQRLIQFILTHASADGTLHKTQQQIAHHLGTTREVIARLIQEFVAQEFIRTQRGSMAIIDLFGLRRAIAPDAILSKSRTRQANPVTGTKLVSPRRKT